MSEATQMRAIPLSAYWLALLAVPALAPLLFRISAEEVTQPTSSVLGEWSPATEWPVLPIHASLTSDGELLTFGADAPPESATGFGDKRYDIFEPSTGEHTTTFQDSHDYFCSLTLNLPESGDLLIAGGDDFVAGSTGTALATGYSPSTGLVNSMPSMATPRWYPTGTVLPDGDIVVQGGLISGSAYATTPERYDATSGWQTLTGATSNDVFGVADGEIRWWYPRAWVDPNGEIFGIAQSLMYTLDPDNLGSLTEHGQIPVGYRGGGTSTAVMYEPGKILQVGGGSQSNVGAVAGLKSAAIIDITSGTPVVTPTADMSYPRQWANSTVLPNGQVLVNGGSDVNNTLTGVAFPSEIWDPTTGTWTVVAAESEERLYHSSAALLPDGRVFSGGGGSPGPVTNLDAQFFTPPYLFDSGGGPAIRPTIEWAPGGIAYNAPLTLVVGTGQTVSRVTLVKSSATTHSFNADQRFVELSFAQTGNQLTVTAPDSPITATPGYYLLSVISDTGVVSESVVVSLLNSTAANSVEQPGTDIEPPSLAIAAPSEDSVEFVAAIGLQATATDNVAVQAVEFRLENRTAGQDVTYWDGAQWGPSRTWFAASLNSSAWDANVPVTQGSYRFRARAVDTSGNHSDVANRAFSVSDIAITTPAPNTTLTDSTQTFTWNATIPVDEYWLRIGSTQGATEHHASGPLGTNTTTTVTGLPTNGQPIWVRLFHRQTNGPWNYLDYQYTATNQPVTITTPTPGTTLTTSTQTFTWTDTIPADEYTIDIGSTQGATDHYTSGPIVTTTTTATSLPTNGQPIWVRLSHRQTNGPWTTIDYQYTAANQPVAITTPAPNTTLTDSTQTFTWNATIPVDEYWLRIGSTQGATEHHASGPLGTNTTTTVTGLPTNGQPIWVRLFHRQTNGPWNYLDYQYTATNQPVTITTPTPGTTLTTSTQTFTWTDTIPADEYTIDIGSTQGATDHYTSGPIVTTTTTATSLPTNGQPIWVRLSHRQTNGPWTTIDYQYTAANQPVAITTPAPNTTLTDSTQTFTWNATIPVDEYWLRIGSTQGATEHHASGPLGTNTTTTVTGLPTNGQPIWVRLFHRQTNGPWNYLDYQYTATNQPVTITTPTPGTTLTTSTQTFTWTDTIPADEYTIDIGSTQGATDHYTSGPIVTTTTTATSLPTNGQPIWVRLSHRQTNGPWTTIDYQYTAANQPVAITTPAPNTTLTDSTQTFTWNATIPVDEYWLRIGSTQGATEHHASGPLGTNTTTTVTGLPTNGQPIWVRLFHRQTNGPWNYLDYQYTATN